MSWPMLAILSISMTTSWADDPDESPLTLSKPVACLEVRGFNDYRERSSTEYRPGQKMLVYYTIKGSQFVEDDRGRFRPHLVQYGTVRSARTGKTILKRSKIAEFRAGMDFAPSVVYLTMEVLLDGLRPGQYELVIEAEDRLVEGSKPGSSVIEFSIKKPPEPPGPTR